MQKTEEALALLCTGRRKNSHASVVVQKEATESLDGARRLLQLVADARSRLADPAAPVTVLDFYGLSLMPEEANSSLKLVRLCQDPMGWLGAPPDMDVQLMIAAATTAAHYVLLLSPLLANTAQAVQLVQQLRSSPGCLSILVSLPTASKDGPLDNALAYQAFCIMAEDHADINIDGTGDDL